jgi:hypothetical protein
VLLGIGDDVVKLVGWRIFSLLGLLSRCLHTFELWSREECENMPKELCVASWRE